MMYVHIAVFSQVPIRDALHHPRANQERWEHQCWAAFVPSPYPAPLSRLEAPSQAFHWPREKWQARWPIRTSKELLNHPCILDVTSASRSPVLNKSRALGMLRKRFVTPKNANLILEHTCLEHGLPQDYKTRCFLFLAQCLNEASSAKFPQKYPIIWFPFLLIVRLLKKKNCNWELFIIHGSLSISGVSCTRWTLGIVPFERSTQSLLRLTQPSTALAPA